MPVLRQVWQSFLQSLKPWRRNWRAAMRDTWVLLREFRAPLLLFLLTWVIGAWSFQRLWNQYYLESISFSEALYDALTMTFFQSAVEFPGVWYLDIYFFIMPAVGLVFLALGIADFVTMLFNRNLRQSKWEAAVASTYRDHIIICGLGRLGLRVVRELVSLGEEIVGIEYKSESPNFSELRSLNIPIVVGDARNADMLDKAGLEHAKAIIICTNDDLMNLQIASRIRERNKNIRLVMRMFDDEFARSMADRFDVSAVFSASLLAAPAFAGAAIGAEIIQTFKVADRVLVMGRVQVKESSKLDGAVISTIEHKLDISVVLLQSGEVVDVQPDPETGLKAGDIVAVVGELSTVKQFASKWNHPSA